MNRRWWLACCVVYLVTLNLAGVTFGLIVWGLWIGSMIGYQLGLEKGRDQGLDKGAEIGRLGFLLMVEQGMVRDLAPDDPRRIEVAKEKGALMRSLHLKPEDIRVERQAP